MRKRKTTIIDDLKTYAKGELQKMCYREKLGQIEAIIKKAKHLCKQYGYFYITYPMFTLNDHQQVTESLWIHPNVSATEPLHPIRKPTEC